MKANTRLVFQFDLNVWNHLVIKKIWQAVIKYYLLKLVAKIRLVRRPLLKRSSIKTEEYIFEKANQSEWFHERFHEHKGTSPGEFIVPL